MTTEQTNRLAEKNLALQHKLISENASALGTVHYLVSEEVMKIYDLLKSKQKINQQATELSNYI